jgi:transposase
LKHYSLSENQVRAAELLAQGFSQREVCKELDIGKGTLHRWKSNDDFNSLTNELIVKINGKAEIVDARIRQINREELKNSYADYLAELKIVRARQKKWSAAVTETGIRSLKVVNSYLALAEKAPSENLSRQEMNLVKLIPSFMRAACETMRSASDSEDKAYSLAELAIALDELSTTLPSQSEQSHFKNISPRDS